MQNIRTNIGTEKIFIGASRYDGEAYVCANYFVGNEYPNRDLRLVDGVTIADVLAQAYQDLA
jgi:hypothetical protein